MVLDNIVIVWGNSIFKCNIDYNIGTCDTTETIKLGRARGTLIKLSY